MSFFLNSFYIKPTTPTISFLELSDLSGYITQEDSFLIILDI
jgi:hypothetical protein